MDKFALIEWIDSQSPNEPGWLDVGEISTELEPIRSAGMVISEDDNQITLTVSAAESNSLKWALGAVTIPKVAIKNMVQANWPDKTAFPPT